MILILEDDLLIAEHIKAILEENDFDDIVLGSKFEEGLLKISELPIHLVLLDINLNEKRDGIDFSKILREKNIGYIFISAQSDPIYHEKIIQANPLGYIHKPFKPIQIITTIKIALKQLNSNELIIDDGKNKHRFILEDICYFKSNRNYVEIHCENHRYVVRKTLSEISSLLNSENFIQSHRSYIVNMKKINRISIKELFIGETTIPVSSKYKNQFLRI